MHSERLPLVQGGSGRTGSSVENSAMLVGLMLAFGMIWLTVQMALNKIH